MGGLIGGGLLVGAAGNYFASREQRKAAEAGAELTAEQAEAARLEAGLGQNAIVSNIEGGQQVTSDLLGQAYAGAQGYLGQGYGRSRQDILAGGQLAGGAVSGGTSAGLASLYGGAAQGIGYLSGAQSGVDSALQGGIEGARGAMGEQLGTQGISAYDVTGAQDRAGKMLDAGLYSGFESDPGYQFRLQQGEQAINRAASARGGRYGGATLKALQEHGQGLASQEFANFSARRQAELSGAGMSDAQRAGLLTDQAARTDAAAQAGAQNRFSAGQNLAGLYGSSASQSASAAQSLGASAAGIATETGRGAAGMQADAGQSLADIYGRTGMQLSTQSANAGAGLGGLESDYYKGLADLEWQATGAENNATAAAAGMAGQQLGTLAAANQAGVPYAGAGWAALGQMGTQAATLGALYAMQQPGTAPTTDPNAVVQ